MATMLLDLDPYCISQAEFDDPNACNEFKYMCDYINDLVKYDMLLNEENELICTNINEVYQCDVNLSDSLRLNGNYWICKMTACNQETYVYLIKNKLGNIIILQSSYDSCHKAEQFVNPEAQIVGFFIGSNIRPANYVLK
jgi:hypothetical protein